MNGVAGGGAGEPGSDAFVMDGVLPPEMKSTILDRDLRPYHLTNQVQKLCFMFFPSVCFLETAWDTERVRKPVLKVVFNEIKNTSLVSGIPPTFW